MTVPQHVARRVTRESSSPSITLVGVLGELFITAALVLVGFVFWQLYWTSYQVAGPVNEAIHSYSEAHAPATSNVGERRTSAPPAFTQSPGMNEVYGLVHVPSWNWMRIPLAETTSHAVLDQGFAGHYKETAQPGEIGNFSIAGHRRTYGNNFRWIDRLQDEDKVVVELDNYYIVYSVKSREIVEADDETNTRVIAPVIGDVSWTQAPTQRWMTMTTCHPEYGNSQRFIVHLSFESWTPKDTGVPAELAEEPTA